MKPYELNRLVIVPTLSALAEFDTKPGLVLPEAVLLLTAIPIQESKLQARRQIPDGQALSFWQIEMPTAIDTLKRWKPARDFCAALCLPIHPELVIDKFKMALQYNDAAACAIARGILRLNHKPLRAVGDEIGAWIYYLESWRPRKYLDGVWGVGKPIPASWHAAYQAAMDAL